MGVVGDNFIWGGGVKSSHASPARPSGNSNMNLKIYEKKKSLEWRQQQLETGQRNVNFSLALKRLIWKFSNF